MAGTLQTTVGLFGVTQKELSQGKSFILSGKVRENEFCKVVGTMYRETSLCSERVVRFHVNS